MFFLNAFKYYTWGAGTATPPAATTEIFIMGRQHKRKSSLMGTTLTWKAMLAGVFGC